MSVGKKLGWSVSLGLAVLAPVVAGMLLPSSGLSAQTSAVSEVNYTKDIAPILQRSCENCHRPDGAGPMSLTTYDEVRPWARAIKQRTGVGPDGRAHV